MSAVFENIQDLYQRSIQPGSKVVYRTKYFIQAILYTFDELYYSLTTVAKLLAEKSGKYLPLEMFYPELDNRWCAEFVKYYNELNLNNIILDYYEPIFYYTDSKAFKSIRNNKHNKVYTIIPFEKLYPKIFMTYLESKELSTDKFDPEFMNRSDGVKIGKSITADINKFIDSGIPNYEIPEHIHLMISNMVYIPRDIKFDIKFMETLLNKYVPEYKNFIIDYLRVYYDVFSKSTNELCHIFSTLYLTVDPLRYKLHKRMLTEWFQFYYTEDGKKHKRNICKNDNIDGIFIKSC